LQPLDLWQYKFCEFTVRPLQGAAFLYQIWLAFNPQFTDKDATCMIIGENIFVMFSNKRFFKTFTKKEICDATKDTEVILALSIENSEKWIR
jgi:predicted lactoylglutathione lyase